ncbi:MAG: hypothetical protein IH898_08310 [Planctomycetes bacterium]|nr:hypothetical protein [Planctomycetota bacterium]
MRCILCTLIVCLLVGCRNQTLPLSNPFMAPNRVPPPATRTLLPGTAQPYYPGDPVPNSPAIGVPASTYQPPATYGPAPTYPPPSTVPATPTNPPGGWNTYPQSAPVSSVPNGKPSGQWNNNIQQASANISLGPASLGSASLGPGRGESVQVPTDNESLRFAQSQQVVDTPVMPAAYEGAQLTARQTQQFTNWQNPVTPTQFVQQPPIAQQRQVSIREISSSELPYANVDSSPARRLGRDGFRPQGSSRTARDQAQAIIRPTEPATSGREFAPVQEAAERFGFDPQYQWLRGQLQRSPTTGQWQLRYVPRGGSPDQFGGNVLVANPHVLGNLQPGEHVSVQGRLEMVQLDAQSMIPAYTITVLQRQQQDLR